MNDARGGAEPAVERVSAPRATVLEVEGVDFAWGRRQVLSAVSFSLRAGELVALVGPNGSGKTTLLQVLLGSLSPLAGVVRMAGTDVRGMSRKDRARRLTLVPQDTHVDFDFRVRDVVELGRYAHGFRSGPSPDPVEAALDLARLRPLEDRSVSELSGGERLRVHLGRALAQDTPILLLDEPMANLDPKHQLAVMDLLRQLTQRGRTVLASLHDLGLAARTCDRILLLDGGRLVASGPPEQVLTPEALARSFQVEARFDRDEVGRLVSIVPMTSLEGDDSTPGSPRRVDET